MRKIISKAGCLALALLLTGCSQAVQEPEMTPAPTPTSTPKVYSWEDAMVYQAEEGMMVGNVTINKGIVEGFEKAGEDSLIVKINIEETGFYDINISSKSMDGNYKENYVYVDEEKLGAVSVEGKTFTDSILERVYMEPGEHEVRIEAYWGWIAVDKLEVKMSDELDNSRFDIEPVLVNQNATDSAKRLMTYLCDIYGTDILSGQYCDTGMYGNENAVIWKTTGGKYPAILGLDMIEYTPSRVANGSSSQAVEHALQCWEEGGIVTFCWHWNAPEKYITGKWYSAFYKEHTNIDLAKIMSGEDKEGYDLLMKDIDAIAKELLRLQEADVPILWRPLHEASGGWFWWGDAGAEAYKELYVLLYDRLTNEYGLNNLIWVWNGQDKEWYPGDEYVDIIGEDIYPGEKVYTPQTSKYLEVMDYTDAKKMIILSENGCMFDPDLAIRDGAMWGSFATWGGEFISRSKTLMALSEQYTEEAMVKKVYEHEHVITRDELPDLKNYPLREE